MDVITQGMQYLINCVYLDHFDLFFLAYGGISLSVDYINHQVEPLPRDRDN